MAILNRNQNHHSNNLGQRGIFIFHHFIQIKLLENSLYSMDEQDTACYCRFLVK